MGNRKIGTLSSFQFKQFSVSHAQSSMKVGTDAVLLGAWASSVRPERILDIGTGCGVIALMLAQRFSAAQIDAIDIDEKSILEARQNFQESPWAERLKAHQIGLQDWQSTPYDLIVSNPPYFANSHPIQHPSRALARSQAALDFQTLISRAQTLLKPAGTFAVIIPAQFQAEFELRLKDAGLFCMRRTAVLPHTAKAPALYLIEASGKAVSPIETTLIIREAPFYHASYLELTRDFYLFS